MHFEILVEELSAEKVLHNILPKLITGEHTYNIITFQGKRDILRKLPQRLKAYSRWIPKDYLILILIDRDSQDCHELKAQLEQFATDAKLNTKSNPNVNNEFSVITRIAIEEIEAWFFGDEEAVRIAYPGAPKNFSRKAKYREPDPIQGGTWEALERVLKSAGYFKTGLRKTECAHKVSLHMEPLNNRSRSFQVFWEGLTYCLENLN